MDSYFWRGGSIVFATASHQKGLDTRSMTRKPIVPRIKKMGRSGKSQGSSPAGLCCSSTHLLQCGSNEPCCFLDANLGPGTWQQGLVIYIGDKGVNVAARPPEGGPNETGGLSASNMPLISIPHPARMLDSPAKAGDVLCVTTFYKLLANIHKTRPSVTAGDWPIRDN